MKIDILTRKGINIEEVKHSFPNLKNYEESLKCYLHDDFFTTLDSFVVSQDYAMAKDATKGLMILAQELKVFKLYQALSEVYEDLLEEEYQEINKHLASVTMLHKELRGIFEC